MSESSEFEPIPDPESGGDNGGRSLRKERALRIASAVTLVGIAGGMLWMAYGIDETTHHAVSESDQEPVIPVDTVMSAAPQESTSSGDTTEYIEAAGIGFLLGISGAAINFARKSRQELRLDGSHDQYDDPLDSRLFEGYCKQVTSKVVWIDDKIIGSGSHPYNPEINVE